MGIACVHTYSGTHAGVLLPTLSPMMVLSPVPLFLCLIFSSPHSNCPEGHIEVFGPVSSPPVTRGIPPFLRPSPAKGRCLFKRPDLILLHFNGWLELPFLAVPLLNRFIDRTYFPGEGGIEGFWVALSSPTFLPPFRKIWWGGFSEVPRPFGFLLVNTISIDYS